MLLVSTVGSSVLWLRTATASSACWPLVADPGAARRAVEASLAREETMMEFWTVSRGLMRWQPVVFHLI
jgi:hypothetical protein